MPTQTQYSTLPLNYQPPASLLQPPPHYPPLAPAPQVHFTTSSYYQTTTSAGMQWPTGLVPVTPVVFDADAPWASANTQPHTNTILDHTELGKTYTKPKNWELGSILTISHVVPTLDPNVKRPEHAVHTDLIGHVTPKVRYAIVVAIFKDSMTALPIFTASPRGCASSASLRRYLTLSVVDPSQVGPVTERSALPTMLRVSTLMREGKTQFTPRDGSHVILTKSYQVENAWPLRKHGKLEPESRDLLLSKFRQCTIMGTVHVNDQLSWWQQKEADELEAARKSSSKERPSKKRKRHVDVENVVDRTGLQVPSSKDISPRVETSSNNRTHSGQMN